MLTALLLLAVGVLILVLHCFGVFPRVELERTASQNNWRRITMQPRHWYDAITNQSMIGVYAQERVENWLDWLCMILCAWAVGLAIVALPVADAIGIPAALVGALLGKRVAARDFWHLRSELIGHTVEAVVAARREPSRFNLFGYIWTEAEKTLRNKTTYGTLFSGKFETAKELEDAMLAWLPVARILAATQKPALDAFKG